MNFTYNDAWFVNESLAFYLSTITPNDPEASLATRHHEPTTQSKIKFRKQAANGRGESSFVGSCAKFCDNLMLSVKGKMFVLELNLKLKFQSMSSLARRCLPSLVGKATGQSELEDIISKQSFEGPNWSQESSFWRNIEQPSSRKSLGAQQEKILHRLEQAVQAKRNQQHQERSNMDQQLFNMNGPELSGVLGHIRSRKDPAHHRASSGSLSSLGCKMGTAGRLKRRKSRWIASAWRARLRNNITADGDGSTEKLCVICYTNAPNIFTLPCKHHEICSDCFIEIIYMAVKHAKYPLKCVVCRQKIEKIRCSRKLLLSVIEKNRIMP